MMPEKEEVMRVVICILVVVLMVQVFVSCILLDRAVAAEKQAKQWRRLYEQTIRKQ